jgi:CDP-glucose 4,6-dehydratase
MEDLVTAGAWSGRSVLLTGHTGFKGAWLSLWLHRLGARVHGLALDLPTDPSLFDAARVGEVLASDTRLDLRDAEATHGAFERIRPEVVFHLAAQPLVAEGYRDPVQTYAVNLMGTVHVLDAVRRTDSVRAAVVITTDKCYENREWAYPYRETDRLGGYDPYSNSKACTELVVDAYRSSYFSEQGVALATARAGNVIGGGDWAAHRLIPDCVRALLSGTPLALRYPHAVRPWQHVLDPLAGYLRLAEMLLGEDPLAVSEAWNFGPDTDAAVSVGEVVATVANLWGGEIRLETVAPGQHEAGQLRLDSSKTRARLGWQPRWTLQAALEQTIAWYRAWSQGRDMQAVSLAQIARYEPAAR